MKRKVNGVWYETTEQIQEQPCFGCVANGSDAGAWKLCGALNRDDDSICNSKIWKPAKEQKHGRKHK